MVGSIEIQFLVPPQLRPQAASPPGAFTTAQHFSSPATTFASYFGGPHHPGLDHAMPHGTLQRSTDVTG